MSLAMPSSLLSTQVWNSEQKSQLATKADHQQTSSGEKGREISGNTGIGRFLKKDKPASGLEG